MNDLSIILTAYKRNYFDEQIKAIFTSEGVGFNNKYFRKITNNEPEVMMTEKDEEAMKKAKQDME